MIIKNHFHKKGFALGLVVKQRLAASRKWPTLMSDLKRGVFLWEVKSVGFICG